MYDAALRESTRRTYRTGQRAYDRFVQDIKNGEYYPFHQRTLSETELNLAFFMASLLMKPSINSASTILGYETHVKYAFREEGCPETLYQTTFLKQIRRGICNTLPGRADKRCAMLLPLLTGDQGFCCVNSDQDALLHFATVIGFIAMLRPHVYALLRPDSFTLVTFKGRWIQMAKN